MVRIFVPIMLGVSLFCSTAFADIFEQDGLSFTKSIDLEQKRHDLDNRFPKMNINAGIKRRDALEDFRRALDRFNRVHLNGYNGQIKALCVEAKQIEKEVNRLGRNNQIKKSERDSILEEIEEVRGQCMDKNYANSDLWRLYQNFLDLYRLRDRESKADLLTCISNNACRRRES